MATLTITKEEFEAHLCVAISPNSEVYEKVQPHFETYFATW